MPTFSRDGERTPGRRSLLHRHCSTQDSLEVRPRNERAHSARHSRKDEFIVKEVIGQDASLSSNRAPVIKGSPNRGFFSGCHRGIESIERIGRAGRQSICGTRPLERPRPVEQRPERCAPSGQSSRFAAISPAEREASDSTRKWARGEHFKQHDAVWRAFPTAAQSALSSRRVGPFARNIVIAHLGRASSIIKAGERQAES